MVCLVQPGYEGLTYVLFGCCILEACSFLKTKWGGRVDVGRRGSREKLKEEKEGKCNWDLLYERRFYFKLEKERP